MENKLHIPQTSNDFEQRAKTKEDIKKAIQSNLNYIYVALMIIANCILSVLQIEGGSVTLTYPQTFWGWCLWFVQIFMTTFIGVMILNAFRRQGIKKGHILIKDTYDKYLQSIAHGEENSNPRSLKEYLRKQTMKDGFSKGSILVLLNLLAVSLAISFNANSVLALVVNIIFAIGFGIKSMLDAEEFVVTELIVWYNQRIIKNINNKEIKDGRNEERIEESGVGHSEPSGIQQAEELRPGQNTSDTIEPSRTDNQSEAIRILE